MASEVLVASEVFPIFVMFSQDFLDMRDMLHFVSLRYK